MQNGVQGKGECWVGTNPHYDRSGPSSNCKHKDGKGRIIGGAGANAVYQMDPYQVDELMS